MPDDPRKRRAARHAQPAAEAAAAPVPRKKPITVERITDAALEVVATQGYDALTIRRVAAVLGTGPSSLYAHIVNKDDIDELLIGRLYAEVALPEPDPAAWREQLLGVCTQIRDLYLKYPGVSRAALAVVPTNLDTLRVGEGILAILLAGGVAPRTAAWARDALSLYVSAYALEQSVVQQRRKRPDQEWVLGQDELLERFTALPVEQFPHTQRHAADLISGTGPDRFAFAVNLLVNNL
ncbi:TetR/AcrR family transcriptional regulator [Streptomyces sp. PTM05]|uniref:TetR/AcrR family transcriptional regulator n=1 Tax=Streptantibioticus parmotrematis TaxID=2873249 RepID=A0ABS7R2N2_9ACTN|nr:TetR/AcrR family transcriptional regulator [Streptantibioticus parmotrematis]MBY8889159.1 TetR/AcrR family transcriptional regulator [Streptantibioticus parmotrematis]